MTRRFAVRRRALAPSLAGFALGGLALGGLLPGGGARAQEMLVAPVAASQSLAAVPGSVTGTVSGPFAGAAPRVRVLSGWTGDDGRRVAAIEIRLAPGWHTYWRVPGEAGIPPRFDWSGSENLAGVAYEWPRPDVFESAGMVTLGYERTLVLPVRLQPADPGAPMRIALAAEFGVCSDICVAAQASVEMTIEPGAAEDGRGEIEAALAERARNPDEAGVLSATCGLSQDGDGTEITATVTFSDPAGPGEIAIIEPGRPDVWIGMPESRTEGRTLTASAPIEALDARAGPVLSRGDVRLTVLGPTEAVDIRGCEAPG